MKESRMESNVTHLAARGRKSAAFAVLGAGLTLSLLVATAPLSTSQGNNPDRMLQSSLPQGKTAATATKPELLGAITNLGKNNRQSMPEAAGAAAQAHPEWSRDILRASFQAVGTGRANCQLLARILSAIISANPDDAAELTEMAARMAGSCTDAFERAAGADRGRGGQEGEGDQQGEGNFGNVPGNQNPAAGSVGGSGGQGNVVAICHNGRTIFVSPRGAENHLRTHEGDTAGPCTVTPTQNQ